ncbi:hypothetical protein D3C85_1879760 [compost metagenome]
MLAQPGEQIAAQRRSHERKAEARRRLDEQANAIAAHLCRDRHQLQRGDIAQGEVMQGERLGRHG